MIRLPIEDTRAPLKDIDPDEVISRVIWRLSFIYWKQWRKNNNFYKTAEDYYAAIAETAVWELEQIVNKDPKWDPNDRP